MTSVYLVEIDQQPIELYKLLKIADLVSGGGEAKVLIAEGYVLLNNEIELQKRKKIYDGDFIQLGDNIIEVQFVPAAGTDIESALVSTFDNSDDIGQADNNAENKLFTESTSDNTAPPSPRLSNKQRASQSNQRNNDRNKKAKNNAPAAPNSAKRKSTPGKPKGKYKDKTKDNSQSPAHNSGKRRAISF